MKTLVYIDTRNFLKRKRVTLFGHMLTENQQKYLAGLPKDEAERVMELHPYNPEIALIAESVAKQIKDLLPMARVEFMGASALGISGQNDIDIYILTPEAQHAEYLPKIASLFGQQIKHKWHWTQDGYEVSVYLADPESPSQKEQIDMHNALKSSPQLLKEYEQLKWNMNGKTYKEYQQAKYEFYNKVLGPR